MRWKLLGWMSCHIANIEFIQFIYEENTSWILHINLPSCALLCFIIFSYFVTYQLFLHFISAMLWYVAHIDISPQNSRGLLTLTTWRKLLFLVNLSTVCFILIWKLGYRKPTKCQNTRMSNTLSYIAQAQVINNPTHHKKACILSCFSKAFFSKSIHMVGNMLNEIWQCPSAAQCVRMVFNSLEFSAEGCRVIFESPEPPLRSSRETHPIWPRL